MANPARAAAKEYIGEFAEVALRKYGPRAITLIADRVPLIRVMVDQVGSWLQTTPLTGVVTEAGLNTFVATVAGGDTLAQEIFEGIFAAVAESAARATPATAGAERAAMLSKIEDYFTRREKERLAPKSFAAHLASLNASQRATIVSWLGSAGVPASFYSGEIAKMPAPQAQATLVGLAALPDHDARNRDASVTFGSPPDELTKLLGVQGAAALKAAQKSAPVVEKAVEHGAEAFDKLAVKARARLDLAVPNAPSGPRLTALVLLIISLVLAVMMLRK